MKRIRNIITFVALSSLILLGCQDDDNSIGNIVAPSNIVIDVEIIGADAENPNGDGSGLVNLRVTADNVISYKFAYGDGTTQIVPTGQFTKRYTSVGLNTYNFVVSAIGTGGLSTTATTEIEVFSSFDDPEAKQFLTGGEGSSKTWYWAAAEPEHLGVGGIVDISPDSYWLPTFSQRNLFNLQRINQVLVFMRMNSPLVWMLMVK